MNIRTKEELCFNYTCVVKFLYFIHTHTHLHIQNLLYSHVIRPWIHSSSGCEELNMLSIDRPVSGEQTRGHVNVCVCVCE